VRHHRSVSYSAELVLLNKHQIYGGAPKVNWYKNWYQANIVKKKSNLETAMLWTG